MILIPWINHFYHSGNYFNGVGNDFNQGKMIYHPVSVTPMAAHQAKSLMPSCLILAF